MSGLDPKHEPILQGDVRQVGNRAVIRFPTPIFGDHVPRGTAYVSDDFMDTVADAERLVWITCDSNLQRDAVRKLDSLFLTLESEKERHVAAECEKSANLILGL